MAETNNSQSSNSTNVHPPGAWLPFLRGFQRILAPVERFLAIEAASGIILLAAAAAALFAANSSWRDTYFGLWHIEIGFRFGGFAFDRSLHFWINEGLMTIFFFVAGLEIRREIHSGDLSEIRRAALPLAAAGGGMLVPALIFLGLNLGRSSANGWAIPMATDIAFAVGAFALLGSRVNPSLRILLLALAIIDDLGAIAVIAWFYSTDISAAGFAVLGLGIMGILTLQWLGIRSALSYVVPAVVIWTGAYVAGIHPTLAGVIVGLMTPATPWYGPTSFLDQSEAQLRSLRTSGVPDERALLPHLDTLKTANREAVSPVERLQYLLHGVVAFAVMPLFAFANAGVPFREFSLSGDAKWVFWGVALGLIVGKPIGIFSVSWIAARAGAVKLPHGVRWSGIGMVGIVGGIGFTMSLFIAQLAFAPGPLLEAAKVGILCGSGLAGILSLFAGYYAADKPR